MSLVLDITQLTNTENAFLPFNTVQGHYYIAQLEGNICSISVCVRFIYSLYSLNVVSVGINVGGHRCCKVLARHKSGRHFRKTIYSHK